MTQVALAHRVNANLVHGGRNLERERRLAAKETLDAVKVASAASTEAAGFGPVKIEQRVGGGTIAI